MYSGEPAIFVNKEMLNEKGDLKVQAISCEAPYLVDKLQKALFVELNWCSWCYQFEPISYNNNSMLYVLGYTLGCLKYAHHLQHAFV